MDASKLQLPDVSVVDLSFSSSSRQELKEFLLVYFIDLLNKYFVEGMNSAERESLLVEFKKLRAAIKSDIAGKAGFDSDPRFIGSTIHHYTTVLIEDAFLETLNRIEG